MAMTKAEKARMEELEEALALARALRWPEYPAPAPMTQAEINANLVEGGMKFGSKQMVARGYFPHCYSNDRPAITYGCSDGYNHSTNRDVTSTQQCGSMFAAAVDAWRWIRVKKTEEFAKYLAHIDKLIADA